MPNQHENTKLMRVPLHLYETVKAISEAEDRTMSAQLTRLVEKGLQAEGITVSAGAGAGANRG